MYSSENQISLARTTPLSKPSVIGYTRLYLGQNSIDYKRMYYSNVIEYTKYNICIIILVCLGIRYPIVYQPGSRSQDVF